MKVRRARTWEKEPIECSTTVDRLRDPRLTKKESPVAAGTGDGASMAFRGEGREKDKQSACAPQRGEP